MFKKNRIEKHRFVMFGVIICLCMGILLSTSGCVLGKKEKETKDSSDTVLKEETTTSAATEASATEASETEESESTPSSSETLASSEVPTEPSVSETLYTNPESMYSSYAHMVSFDPVNKLARFDYFDMLTGKDAIDWLVANKGYSVAEATAIVDDFADSEYIYKNVNPQLRTADMSKVKIAMMYRPDGTELPGAESMSFTYAEFVKLYTTDSSVVLDSFFYYVTVSGGEITKVTQVYWP